MNLWTWIKAYIAANPAVVAVLGVIGTIGGIVISILLYRLSRSRRLLAYATRTFRIIPAFRIKLPGLQVTYNRYDVKSLSVTRVTVWNAGNESLRRSDIPQAHPPIISVPDGVTLFEGELIESTKAANNITLNPVHVPITGYAVEFDFLDPGDGAVFSIVHESDKIAAVRMSGELIGARIRRTVAQGETPDTPRDSRWPTGPQATSGRAAMGTVWKIFVAVAICGLLVACFSRAVEFGLLLAITASLVGFGLLLLSRRAYPPPQLKKYDENLNV